MSRLICITGPDGAGKSTLIANVCKSLQDVHVAGIWDILSGNAGLPLGDKTAIDNYLCALTPNARLLFLTHALQFACDRAENSGKKIILWNSYYYKYFASEITLGADHKLAEMLAGFFNTPALTLFLELDAHAAAARKKKLTRYECGLAVTPDAASFIAFQMEVQKTWKLLHMDNVVALDARLQIDVIAESARTLIAAICK